MICRIIKVILCIVILPFAATRQTAVFAQRPVCAYCGTPLPNGVHSASCPYSKTAAKSSTYKKHSSSADMNNMITGMLFQSMLTSLFADTSAKDKAEAAAKQKAAQELAAKQAAELAIAKAIAAQKEYEKMMQSYKQLGEDGERVAFKSLSNTSLGLKGLDGDDETLARKARTPFDTAGSDLQSPPAIAGAPTPFFGDTMPIADIRTLVNADNDPAVVDLRDAKEYIAKNLKTDEQKPAPTTEPKNGDKPAEAKETCAKLNQKLNGYITQRANFQKTVNLAQSQLDVWKTANRNALLTAAKDGLEYFTGQLLEGLSNRGKAADRLSNIYVKNAEKMAKEGIDISAVEAKIKRLKTMSSSGKVSEITSKITDWQGFVTDGLPGLMTQMTSGNAEIQEILKDPKIGKYFETDAPDINDLLDISKIAASNKVFGKWVAKKLPVIAGAELAVKQTYNALDWFLSYQKIKESNKINGKVLETAKSIQQNIDGTRQEISNCR